MLVRVSPVGGDLSLNAKVLLPALGDGSGVDYSLLFSFLISNRIADIASFIVKCSRGGFQRAANARIGSLLN